MIPPALKCIEGPEGCAGAVQLRASLTGTGIPMVRCGRHHAGRLALQARLDREYPDSGTPANAGERWDDD